MLVLNPLRKLEFGSDDSFDEDPPTATMLLVRPRPKPTSTSPRLQTDIPPLPMLEAPRPVGNRLLLLSFALATVTFMLGVLLASAVLLRR